MNSHAMDCGVQRGFSHIRKFEFLKSNLKSTNLQLIQKNLTNPHNSWTVRSKEVLVGIIIPVELCENMQVWCHELT